MALTYTLVINKTQELGLWAPDSRGSVDAILADVHASFLLHREGVLGGSRMPEDANPGFECGSREAARRPSCSIHATTASPTQCCTRILSPAEAGLRTRKRDASVASHKSSSYSALVAGAPANPIETDTVESAAPEPGQVVRARTRAWLVEEVEPRRDGGDTRSCISHAWTTTRRGKRSM